MKKYNFQKSEKKWQKEWANKKIYQANDKIKGKKNSMLLVEFPYPSGDLHIGHWFAFAIPDILARYKRMIGENVMYPIGFDAFGLPAENAAIKRKISPRDWTEKNIKFMTKQLESMGASFDWSRKVSTIDPEYYKWTQWLFLKMYEKNLAYRKQTLANWCPSCKTVLANEQVVNGGCERCGSQVVQKELEQWMFKITKYADRLIDESKKLDWPETTKLAQKNWIGRSEGAVIKFSIFNFQFSIDVFTTRPDTIFGATYVVLAPEHKIIQNLEFRVQNLGEVKKYIEQSSRKTDLERQENKEKTGVELKGIKAINPANGREVSVWISDYVLAHYGTGAVMAVPAHDERDFDFAKKYSLPIKEVVVPERIDKRNPPVPGKNKIERKNVQVIVRNPKNGKYLCLKWKKFPWVTFPMGGIEEDESLIDAAKREVAEETGYINLGNGKVLGGQVKAEYFAAHKDVNRISYTNLVSFDLMDESQIELSKEESEEHEVFWENENKIKTKDYMVHAEMDVWIERMGIGDIAYTENGVLINSEEFTGMESENARREITDWLIKKGQAKRKINYRLHDWVLSRQRYWGVPIPIIKCADCGFVPVPEKDLPVKLPPLKDFLPTDDGRSPLAKAKSWVKVKCPKCKKMAERETDTMDTFVDSSWYFIRYTDSKNKKKFADAGKMKSWLPVPMYIGGAEHNTMHLLYSRFFTKVLHDLKLVNFKEPFVGRVNHGVILGPDGQKMSKSRGNVVNPDEEVKKYGADCIRMYLAFMGPYDQGGPWNPSGILGIKRFLDRIFALSAKMTEDKKLKTKDNGVEKLLHKTIKKVGDDIKNFRFNTAISSMMIFLNEIEKEEDISLIHYSKFLILLSPFAPHLAEEIWYLLKAKNYKLKTGGSVHLEKWPKYNPKLVKDDAYRLIVQVNGKTRGVYDMILGEAEEKVKILVLKEKEISKWIGEKEIRKIIFVKDRLINFIV